MRRETALAAACAAAWAVGTALGANGGLWVGAGGAALLLGSLVLATSREVRRELAPRRAVGELALGVLVGLAMALATHLAYRGLAHQADWLRHDTSRLYAAFASLPAPVAALVLAPIVLGEELVWRGLVQHALERRLAPGAAALVAAGVYALAHVPSGSPVLVLAALGCGLIWSPLRARTGHLVAPLVAHLVWDYLVLLVLPVR